MENSLPAHTIPRPHTKRLHHLQPVPIRILLPHIHRLPRQVIRKLIQPPLRPILHRIMPVLRAVIHRILLDLQNRSLGHPITRNRLPAFVRFPRQVTQRGRVAAQGLVETGEEVGQAGDGGNGHLAGVGEGCADLVGQAGEGGWVGEQLVGHAGEERGCSFGAGGCEEGGVRLQVVFAEVLVLVLLLASRRKKRGSKRSKSTGV